MQSSIRTGDWNHKILWGNLVAVYILLVLPSLVPRLPDSFDKKREPGDEAKINLTFTFSPQKTDQIESEESQQHFHRYHYK